MIFFFQEVLQCIIEYCEIFFDEMVDLMCQVMCGEVLLVMIVVIFIGLWVKKEIVGEIVGVVMVMCELVLVVLVEDCIYLIDIVGIGGDGLYMFNIFICVMFVVVVVGVKVVKYGNCSVLFKFGSVDVVEVLGVIIELCLEEVVCVISDIGIGFMFVLMYYLVMKVVVLVCCEMGVCIIFNIFGLLINLVGVINVLMGVFYFDLVGIQVCVLCEFGVECVLVVWGCDNMDEILFGVGMLVGELCDGKVCEYEIYFEDFGIVMLVSCNFKVVDLVELIVMLCGVLDNQLGLVLDIVVFNVGVVLYVVGVVNSIVDGLVCVWVVIVDGSVWLCMQQYVEVIYCICVGG